MKKYIPSQIEPKWQKKWEEAKLYSTDLTKHDKFYCLAEFAYPSGDLHMGHWFTFGGADIFARMKRMQGLNVFFPNGFDAFGLPAENAAIKRGINPRVWTYDNIEKMKVQFASMGASYEWGHQVTTCDPEYYKWNQWIFLRMFERKIAYRGSALVNWCPVDQTVLADEQVVAGKCDRCGNEVTKKQIEQWFLKITEYADRLIWSKETELDWPQSVKEGQNNWIGKSEGVLLKFKSEDGKTAVDVFTTALDTVFGVTFLVISPENPLLAKFTTEQQKQAIEEYCTQAKKKSELERKEDRDKTGIFTGGFVINPFNSEKVPVWVADYVLVGYGTGAVMGVPGHDARDHEFAKKFGLEIKPVIKPQEGTTDVYVEADGFWNYIEIKGNFADKSVLFNSGKYNGLASGAAKKQMSDYIEGNGLGNRQIQYHLHDWSVSRQRYWGTPIPIIHCDKCGLVPVPDKDLPVELPEIVDFTPKGEPPLATAKDWVKVKCPKCGAEAKRDTETLDGFFDNSWYFFRYLDPKNSKEIFDKEVIKKWIPIDIYFGGAEHTLGHTLYSRFFTKFFKDIGLIDVDEYALRRINHGIILGTDNGKMSKSVGNVVDPDKEVKKYGADTIRVYLAFCMPYDATGSWVPERVWGAYRFLQRIWVLFDKVDKNTTVVGNLSVEDQHIMHKTIKKVTEDIEGIKFNTAIASLMEWLNYLSRKPEVAVEEYKTLLLLLAPFAPHIAEELWQLVHGSRFTVSSSINDERITNNQLTDNWSIHQQSWPKFDNKYLEDEEVFVAVQVNGKVRDILVIGKDIVNNKEVVEKMAMTSQKASKFLEGKTVKKTVYIPGKIISLVTGS